MGLLSCSCGNIKLYTVSNDSILTEFTLPSDCRRLIDLDPFFAHVSIQRFGVGGVKMEQPLLGVNRRVETWQILRCMNCEMDAFAAQDALTTKYALGKGQMLVSCALSCGSELDLIGKQLEFSEVFNFCVKPELYPAVLPNDFSEHPEYARVYSELQNKVNQKYKDEENLCKERIRKYQQEQEEKLNEYRKKADRDKALVFNTIRSIAFRRQQGVLPDNSGLLGDDTVSSGPVMDDLQPMMDDVNLNEAVVPGSLRTASILESNQGKIGQSKKTSKDYLIRTVVFQPADIMMEKKEKNNINGISVKQEESQRNSPRKANVRIHIKDDEKPKIRKNVDMSDLAFGEEEEGSDMVKEMSETEEEQGGIEFGRRTLPEPSNNLYSQSVPVQIPFMNARLALPNKMNESKTKDNFEEQIHEDEFGDEKYAMTDIARSMWEMTNTEDNPYDPFPRRRKLSLV